MAREFRDVIAIGSSAGGIEALSALFSTLPRDLPAAMLVVQHSSASSPGFLPEILTRAGELPVSAARNGQAIERGSVYVAPPDHHLFVKDKRLQVTRGPRENSWRPSVDVLFRSVAAEYRGRAVGVVLSGLLYDGAAGLQWIRQSGGVAIVQSPEECQYSEMPLSALATGSVDHCLPLADIGNVLTDLAGTEAPATPSLSDELLLEVRLSEKALREGDVKSSGKPVPLGCPACGGPLTETEVDSVLGYRCHVGHSFSADSLVVGQDEAAERALWVALRTLDERATMLRVLSRRAGMKQLMEHYAERAQESKNQANLIRKLLLSAHPSTQAREVPRCVQAGKTSPARRPSPLST